jgi:hypothetical protein
LKSSASSVHRLNSSSPVIGRINFPLNKFDLNNFILPHLNEDVEPIIDGSNAEGNES